MDWIAPILSALGHLSFALAALSFAMRNILWLRLLAIGSGIVGIVYNSSIAAGYLGPANPELWNVVGWLTLFLGINIWQSLRLAVEQMEAKLDEPSRMLLARAFPTMKSRDFARLQKHWRIQEVGAGTVLLDQEQTTQALHIVLDGCVTAINDRHEITTLAPGAMYGEISFAIQEQYGGSTTRLITATPCRIASLDYDTLHRLCLQSATLKTALLDSILRGLAKKNQLLRSELPAVNPALPGGALTDVERFLAAAVFPNMNTHQIRKLCATAWQQSVEAGDLISGDDDLMVVLNGCVRVLRADGRYIDLGSGHLLGELGLVREGPASVPATLTALQSTRLLRWSREGLRDLRRSDPGLYFALIEHIARDLAIKLSRPLESFEGHERPHVYDSRAPQTLRAISTAT